MRRQPSVFDQAGMECGSELLYIRVQSESEQTNGECQYGPCGAGPGAKVVSMRPYMWHLAVCGARVLGVAQGVC